MLNYRHLRFWCQKVLPLVYDDSLSYYELLCKVVAYLNNLTKDVVKLTEEVAGIEDKTLNKIAEELQRMLQDGTLADILESIALDARLVTGKYLEELPKMPASYTLYSNLADVTAADIYQWYDDLLDAHSDCLNKVTWGVDEDGEPLAYYLFTCDTQRKTMIYDGESTGEVAYERDPSYTTNRMIFFSGLHGNEKQNEWALFNIVKAIVEENGSAYTYIKHNVNLLIAPCVNPYGLTHDSRFNKNGVDINRNFPYYWEEYDAEEANTNKGDSAGSELSTRFCMDILAGYNTKKNHNGTVIIDFHDFMGRNANGEPNQYQPYYYMVAATDPDYRIALDKAGMKMLEYYEANYPNAIAQSERPIRVTNIYQASPTLENYAFHLGFRYTQLQENRTYLFSTQYDEATHNCVYYSCALAVASVGLGFVASKRLREIQMLTDIGCDTDSSLEDILRAMPPKSHYSVNVYDSMEVWNDMPNGQFGTKVNGILEIMMSNEDRVNATLTYSQKGERRNYQWHAIAYQNDNTVTVSPWTLEQSGTLSRGDFVLTGEEGATFDDLVDAVMYRQADSLCLKVSSNDTNLLADLPTSTVGVLTIFATYTSTAIRGGLAIYNTGTNYYLRTLLTGEHSYSDWVEVYTQSV